MQDFCGTYVTALWCFFPLKNQQCNFNSVKKCSSDKAALLNFLKIHAIKLYPMVKLYCMFLYNKNGRKLTNMMVRSQTAPLGVLSVAFIDNMP